VGVPWAGPGSEFTLLFEALTLLMCRQMPVAVKIMQVYFNCLWRILFH
jgi:hypothetical protein